MSKMLKKTNSKRRNFGFQIFVFFWKKHNFPKLFDEISDPYNKTTHKF